MAAADYRLCDVCDGKVFYDANLNYEQGRASEWAKRQAPFRWAGEEQGKPEHDDYLLRLDYLGDWAVICDDCAKTHKTTVVPIESAPAEPKREPLSDEQMRAVLIAEARRIAAQAGEKDPDSLPVDEEMLAQVMLAGRAVERAHRIGGSDGN